MPLWMGNRTQHNAKCGTCGGKGWLPDKTEATHSTDLESQIMYAIIEEHSDGLNIDDISCLSKLDIPTVYRVLQRLRDEGKVRVKSGSPIMYYSASSRD